MKIQAVSPDADRIQAALARAPWLARETIKRALSAEAEVFATEAKLRAPVDTGALRLSILANAAAETDDGVIQSSVVAGEGLSYAGIQEARVGYMAGAAAEVGPGIERAVAEAVDEALRESGAVE